MRKLPNVHPGEVLREDFMAPLELSAYAVAKAIAVPQSRLSAILAGRRAVSADTAARLGRYFGTSARFWLNLQAAFDAEEVAHGPVAKAVARIVPCQQQRAEA